MKLINMRLTGIDKNYYSNKLEQFEQLMIDKDMAHAVEFGKQDTRGAFSISLKTGNHCISQQKMFSSKQELLGYVVGYVMSAADYPYL